MPSWSVVTQFFGRRKHRRLQQRPLQPELPSTGSVSPPASATAPKVQEHHQSSMAPLDRLSVVVPLYMYPLEGAWDPLFEAARAHPEALFTAVVNPNSGPGKDALPDTNYLAALGEMSKIENVRSLGYVHCTYGQRPLDEVTRDVDVYRGWNTNATQSIRLDGIFFDEAPADPNQVDYMGQASDHVRRTWQSALGRAGISMLNPGVVVGREYFDRADHVVVFEQSEEHWERYFVTQGLPQIATSVRNKSVAIVHTCGTTRPRLSSLVREMRMMGLGGIYLTEQPGGGYSKWPRHLEHVVDEAAREH